MMARRSMLGMIGGSVLLAGCGLSSKRASYRVRVTVDAVTYGRQYSGSSVWQINAVRNVRITSEEHAGGAGLIGEAVVLDLPSGPVLVLMRPVDASSTLLPVRITKALDPEVVPTDAGSFVSSVSKLGGWFGEAKAELPRVDWPLMVRFDNIDDPRSVEKVDPEAIDIKRILLETTSDDVTTGIEKKLRWLSNGGLTLDAEGRPTTNPTFAQTIRQKAFSSEIDK
mgnify:CR=1 FL=1